MSPPKSVPSQIPRHFFLEDEDDPNFGKVDNASGNEFAFEIAASPSVAAIAQMNESEAAERISANDDYGNPVRSIPLGQTCQVVNTDVSRYLTLIGDDESLPPGALLHRVALHIMAMIANYEQFELYPDELEDIKLLRFYRFYHSQNDTWWTCTFDSTVE